MRFIWQVLRERGILGINRRNADYVQRYNKRSLYPLVDDKIRTKSLAMEAGIAVPPLYATISSEHENANLAAALADYTDFVIKPAQGAGGEGIVVVTGKVQGRYRLASGLLMDFEDLQYHVSSILSGVYSLGGHRDKAMIEYRVQFDPLFESISYQGVPDIRVIVLQGYPVMAMVRLPTRQSDGKANLHQGAMGVGIDITTGKTLRGVWQNEMVSFHLDTGNTVEGLQVPHWDDFLQLSASCYELTGLGYLGVDIVLDKARGPMVLELNARPGLNIQIANDAGLLARCRVVEGVSAEKQMDAAARVAFAKEAFSH